MTPHSDLEELLTEQVLHELRQQGLKASRRTLYYFEKKDLIQPRMVTSGTRRKRFYSYADFRRIVKAVRYTNMGLTVDVACDLLMKPPTDSAWMFIITEPGMACPFAQTLQHYDEVEMAATVWGSYYDVLLKVGMWHPIDRSHLLYHEFPRWGSRPGHHRIFLQKQLFFARPPHHDVQRSNGCLQAYVFITIPHERIDDLAVRLEDVPEVMELAQIEGDSNVLARIAVSDNRELDRMVMMRLQDAEVTSTRTYQAISYSPEQRLTRRVDGRQRRLF